ncbi:MAG: CRTAC1 family protein [Pirellulaceae bacterium]|nr:CRTAC1 family protein [Pirellulaceae bacterium]MDP6553070.1 CRTAC1 family protein [Pirellulaceae bacterium]
MKKPPPKDQISTDTGQFDEAHDDAVIGVALRASLLVIVVLIAIGGAIAYWLTQPKPHPVEVKTIVSMPKIRSRPPAEAPEVKFIDITKAAGIDFIHENGAYGDKLLPETMGGGGGFLDYDSDGDQDILLVNATRWPWDPRSPVKSTSMKLFRNDGTGQFDDVTIDVGLDVSFYGMGCAFGDFDNDGDTDLFISVVGPNKLFRNDQGKFTDITDTANVSGDDSAWGSSCAWLDYNNDSRLDLFVCNYVQWSKETDLSQNFQLTGVGRAYGPPTAFEGTFPCLYRNDGDGQFTDVSATAGIQVKNPATGVPMAKSMGVATIDLDRDGWMDLIVSNDTVQNFLFHNQHDGTFHEVGSIAGIGFDSAGNARGAMGIDVSYFRNDKTLGVAIGNFANEMTSLYCANEDPLQFVDAAISTGLGPATRLELTFGLFFFDYDLDGRLDLLAANGHLEDEINKVQASQHYEQPPQLFWNCGPDTRTEFQKVDADKCGPDFARRMVGRGAAYADIDEDGDLDVLLLQVGGPPRLLRNDQQQEHHWSRIRLVGTRCNVDAIGAWIEVTCGEQTFRRQVAPTRSYLSQCELPVTFGLGTHDAIERIVVHWPDRSTQVLNQVAVDQNIEISQD